jgi:heme/copper-type cytochrome/quinol oxidase subunit 2
MPAMKDVIRLEPSTNGCDMPTCGAFPMYLQGVQVGIAVLAIPTSIFVIGAIYGKRLRYLKKQNMPQTTMKLNKMLMKALIIHICIIIVFLVIPAMVLFAIMLLGNEKQNVILEIIIVIFTWHSLFDIPAMLYFITPYRKFIWKVLWNALQTVGLDKFMRSEQIIIVQQIPISSGVISSQK